MIAWLFAAGCLVMCCGAAVMIRAAVQLRRARRVFEAFKRSTTTITTSGGSTFRAVDIDADDVIDPGPRYRFYPAPGRQFPEPRYGLYKQDGKGGYTLVRELELAPPAGPNSFVRTFVDGPVTIGADEVVVSLIAGKGGYTFGPGRVG